MSLPFQREVIDAVISDENGNPIKTKSLKNMDVYPKFKVISSPPKSGRKRVLGYIFKESHLKHDDEPTHLIDNELFSITIINEIKLNCNVIIYHDDNQKWITEFTEFNLSYIF